MTKPVIYCLDIETAPLLVYAWHLRETPAVPLNMVHTDWSLLSFAAKRLDKKSMVYRDNRGAKDPRNDRGLMLGLWTVLNEADIVVGHNLKQFDLKKINARFALYDMKPPSPYKAVDTLSEARKCFAFSSNKLEFLSGKLTNQAKLKHNEFPGFSLWTECLNSNPRAWRALERYNKADVIATEELYLKLRPWMGTHPHVGIYVDAPDLCPKCGSAQLQHRGYSTTQAGKYPRLRCNECLGWSRGRKKVA